MPTEKKERKGNEHDVGNEQNKEIIKRKGNENYSGNEQDKEIITRIA